MATLSEVSGISIRRLDVANRADVFAGLGEVERRFGKIDGLVCAAAIQPRSPVHLMEAAAWERVLRTNLDGVVWCYQAAVPGMGRLPATCGTDAADAAASRRRVASAAGSLD